MDGGVEVFESSANDADAPANFAQVELWQQEELTEQRALGGTKLSVVMRIDVTDDGLTHRSGVVLKMKGAGCIAGADNVLRFKWLSCSGEVLHDNDPSD